jgi:hypothetical protein
MRKQHGYAGHFIAWADCLFRLHTSVDSRYRISTVGDWRPPLPPNHEGEKRLAREPMTIGPGRLFETMVFELGADGEPTSYAELDASAYNTAAEAEAGHEALVRKYEQKAAAE